MSNSKCVYYKEKEQKSIDGGLTWVDTGNFRKGGIISTQAAQCGSFTDEYRWIKADYVCDNGNKYNGYKQQVSYDNGGNWSDTGVVNIGDLIEENSKDCGYDEKWFVLTGDKDFICDGASKYKKKEMKYTRDSGTTWNSFATPKYEKGDLISQTSSDCAIPAMKVTYTDNTEKTFYNLTSIDEKTDSNKVNAKEVEIYDAVTIIGYGAFYGCRSLTGVTIGNAVTVIGGDAFNGCSGLTSVTIPDSVTSIGALAFQDCSALTGITIPNSVTSIGNYAFCSCRNLTSITIPEHVASINTGVFQDCSGLTSVTIPDSVKTIGNWAFYECEKLTGVTIPNSVTNIGNFAFCYCYGLTSIIIPDSVTNIGIQTFTGCFNLRTMTVEATTPPTLDSYAISTATTAIYVPADSLDAYKTADGWKDYADKIQAIP